MAELKGTISTSSIHSNINSSVGSLQGNLNNSNNLNNSQINDAANQQGVLAPGQSLTSSLRGSGNLNPGFSGIPVTGYGYIYFLYSAVMPQSQADVTLVPDDTTVYLGILTTNQATRPENYQLYTWVKIRGDDGEKGEQGEQGEKGDSGETTLTINNPLYFVGKLDVDRWQVDNGSRGATFYYQEINVTDTQLVSSTLTEEELINYMNIKISDKTTPIADLIVSKEDVSQGLEQIEQWKYISRVCLVKDEFTDEEEIEHTFYYLRFECYLQTPNIQLPFQVKVI
jgi:hypothetical protein